MKQNTNKRFSNINGVGPQETGREKLIRVDGKQQVVDMLRSADSSFRENMLKQIERRDIQLARELRRLLA